MTAALLLTLVIVVGIIVYLIAFVLANRHARPKSGPIAPLTGPDDLPKASNSLSVLTWNVGYAGLGKEADLIVDGGRSVRALSAADIANAAEKIADWLKRASADFICLQENAGAGFLTRKVPLKSRIEQALAGRQGGFWLDMKSVLVPRILRIRHGMSVHSGLCIESCEALALPQDDTYLLGLLKKNYGTMISRIGIAGSDKTWVVFNVHLSAFDAGGRTRLRQLKELLQLAQTETEKGNLVVIAGDWNMRLTATEFPNQAKEDTQFWVVDFPHEVLPKGWQIAIDPASPTVRTLNARYIPGVNYTTIVDGFVFSPNVALKSVKTFDMGFAFSDHQPVEAQFEARSDVSR